MLNGTLLDLVIERNDVSTEYRQRVHLSMIGHARRQALLDSSEMDVLMEVVRLKLWLDHECTSLLDYLERTLGYRPHTASERVRVSREIQALPEMKAALREGELCFSAVRELTRVAEPRTEGEWIAAVRGKNMRQIEDLVAHHTKGDRPSDRPDPTPKRCKVILDELKPETATGFREARKVLTKEIGAGFLDNDTFLDAMNRRALQPPVSGGVITPPAYTCAITTCKWCKQSWQNGSGLDLLVDDSVRERAECDAKHLGDLEALHPQRVTQTVTPRKREQVFARDSYRCTVPGCRSAHGLDIHHILMQCLGGTHDLWNITLICSAHHRHIHDGHLFVTGRAPDGLKWTWRGGETWRSSHVGPARAMVTEPESASKEEMVALEKFVQECLESTPEWKKQPS